MSECKHKNLEIVYSGEVFEVTKCSSCKFYTNIGLSVNKVLWQIMRKHHLDTKNQLSDKQWSQFVEDQGYEFSSKCSAIATNLFEEWLATREDEQ